MKKWYSNGQKDLVLIENSPISIKYNRILKSKLSWYFILIEPRTKTTNIYQFIINFLHGRKLLAVSKVGDGNSQIVFIQYRKTVRAHLVILPDLLFC